MTIQYCSDLHLEFPENRKLLSRRPIIPTGEVLVLAGDIMPFEMIDEFQDFIEKISVQFTAVYWLPGNHEYYDYDIATKPNPLFEKIRDNFFLVNNQSITYKNINLVFTTLWGRINPRHEWEIQSGVSDFSLIRSNGIRFTPGDFSALHADSLSFLKNALHPKPKGNTIVITHHVPTLLNYPKMYKNSPLTEAFAVELYDVIEDSNADYWIYGHHHVNTPEFTIGHTRLVTNQLGYVSMKEHGLFRRDAVIRLT